MFEMKEEFLTGIDFIDEEHSKLFELANRLYEISHNQFIVDKFDYIVDIIVELKDYTKYHFKHEEDYMKEINHKKIFSHIVEHNDFIEQLDAIDTDLIDLVHEETITKLLSFLYDWLVEHISESDKLIGKDA